ncbi:MAG: fatty acid desaturase, partial [Geminicoccaceae bacterium]|nr:fatty acid desaturase [Geminicoccaceae bacterium]
PEHVSFRTVEEDGGLIAMIARYALLFEALRLVRKYYGSGKVTGSRRRASGRAGARWPWHVGVGQAALALGSLALGQPGLYLLWLYLAVSLSPLLSRLRFLVEHPGENDLTVTTESGRLERPFFAPFNFNYHFEHHCWPSLPPYRLRRAHRYLREQGFYDRHPEYANRSFTGSLVQRSSAGAAAVEALP